MKRGDVYFRWSKDGKALSMGIALEDPDKYGQFRSVNVLMVDGRIIHSMYNSIDHILGTTILTIPHPKLASRKLTPKEVQSENSATPTEPNVP